ncbi:response regulator transcription factor [Paraneptunicella aestuarii]|uniref:helix-turn-helix transcriptional regulator n=1 Tax=Paraneptunicella aestuarii TaxID=2831148 RepID=UPI001E3339E1|nr:LuxR C-terminal-related transcriptional regulator [Paraneptunicella aestuarii]UAA38644.1 response regulator transcription factor [Paraneptunicella aestuarii]
MKDKILAISLLIIMVLNLLDVITDTRLQVPLWHIFEEGFIVLVSGVLAVYLIIEMRHRTKRLSTLSQDLRDTESKLQNMTEQFKQARHQYSEAIQNQLEAWQLSQSEKDVATLLLKGLSFQEIATLRNTKEKTVRQQASAIYAKAGLEGRHELAAWFFEDFLTPTEPV